jgi:ABC-type multidrug transport system permease subunit
MGSPRSQKAAVLIIAARGFAGADIQAALPYSPPHAALTFFSALSCAIALLTRAPEGMAVFVHVVNMPLLFTSTAFVPSRQMPDFLSSVSQVNPLTLAVGALRGSLLFEETPSVSHCLLPLALLALVLFGVATAPLSRAARD